MEGKSFSEIDTQNVRAPNEKVSESNYQCYLRLDQFRLDKVLSFSVHEYVYL